MIGLHGQHPHRLQGEFFSPGEANESRAVTDSEMAANGSNRDVFSLLCDEIGATKKPGSRSFDPEPGICHGRQGLSGSEFAGSLCF